MAKEVKELTIRVKADTSPMRREIASAVSDANGKLANVGTGGGGGVGKGPKAPTHGGKKDRSKKPVAPEQGRVGYSLNNPDDPSIKSEELRKLATKYTRGGSKFGGPAPDLASKAVGGLSSPWKPWEKSPELKALHDLYVSGKSKFTIRDKTDWRSRRSDTVDLLYELAKAGGDKAEALYYNLRRRGMSKSDANMVVAQYTQTENEFQAARNAKKAESAAATEAKKDLMLKSQIAKLRGMPLQAQRDRLLAQGYTPEQIDEAQSALAENISVAERRKQEKARIREEARQRNITIAEARKLYKRQKSAAIEYANHIGRSADADALKHGRMNPVDFMQEFGFESVEDLEERNAWIRQNNRIVKQNQQNEQNAAKIEKDRKKSEEQQKKLINQQNKASEKNTKALLGLTKGLGSLRYLGVAGAAIGGGMAVISKQASLINEAAEGAVEKANFAEMLGIDPNEMHKLETFSQGYGVKAKELHGFVNKMQRELAMSTIQQTALMKEAGFFGIRIHENGRQISTPELMMRIGSELQKSDPNRRVQMMQKLGLDNNMAYLLMRMAQSYQGFTPSVKTNWGVSPKERDMSEQVLAIEAALDESANRDITEGGLGFVWGNLKKFSNWSGLTAIGARMGYQMKYNPGKTALAGLAMSNPIFASMYFGAKKFGGGVIGNLLGSMLSNNGAMQSAVAGVPTIDSVVASEKGGKRIININLGGQQYTFSGNTSADAIRQMKEEFGPALANAIVKELTIAEK